MKKTLLALALPLLLTACQTGPSEKEQQEALEAQVMEVHDQAMAKMGTIYRLRRNITRLRDTLDTQTADTTIARKLSREIDQLNKADEAMMDWMRQYKAPAEDQPHQATMKYLQQEQRKMQHVKSLMDSTITAAQNTHQQYEQK